MAWYFVVLIILVFFGVIGLFAFLGAKGYLGKSTMRTVSTILSGLSLTTSTLASATENKVADIFALAMTLVDKAVHAAENAFYNGNITAEERKERCMKELDALLEAAGIELTGAQYAVIDTLIAAACEEMGHLRVPIRKVMHETESYNENADREY